MHVQGTQLFEEFEEIAPKYNICAPLSHQTGSHHIPETSEENNTGFCGFTYRTGSLKLYLRQDTLHFYLCIKQMLLCCPLQAIPDSSEAHLSAENWKYLSLCTSSHLTACYSFSSIYNIIFVEVLILKKEWHWFNL